MRRMLLLVLFKLNFHGLFFSGQDKACDELFSTEISTQYLKDDVQDDLFRTI